MHPRAILWQMQMEGWRKQKVRITPGLTHFLCSLRYDETWTYPRRSVSYFLSFFLIWKFLNSFTGRCLLEIMSLWEIEGNSCLAWKRRFITRWCTPLASISLSLYTNDRVREEIWLCISCGKNISTEWSWLDSSVPRLSNEQCINHELNPQFRIVSARLGLFFSADRSENKPLVNFWPIGTLCIHQHMNAPKTFGSYSQATLRYLRNPSQRRNSRRYSTSCVFQFIRPSRRLTKGTPFKMLLYQTQLHYATGDDCSRQSRKIN